MIQLLNRNLIIRSYKILTVVDKGGAQNMKNLIGKLNVELFTMENYEV